MIKTRTLVLTSLMTALTCVGTMIIRIPTPGLGYIHPGDGFVLLSGLLLGPIYGSLAAGLGSAMADIFSGYVIYAPATFVIKVFCAMVAYMVCNTMQKNKLHKGSLLNASTTLVLSGFAGETVMVIGYFLFDILLVALSTDTGAAVFAAGVISAASGLLPNVIQAAFGVAIAVCFYPVFKRAGR